MLENTHERINKNTTGCFKANFIGQDRRLHNSKSKRPDFDGRGKDVSSAKSGAGVAPAHSAFQPESAR